MQSWYMQLFGGDPTCGGRTGGRARRGRAGRARGGVGRGRAGLDGAGCVCQTFQRPKQKVGRAQKSHQSMESDVPPPTSLPPLFSLFSSLSVSDLSISLPEFLVSLHLSLTLSPSIRTSVAACLPPSLPLSLPPSPPSLTSLFLSTVRGAPALPAAPGERVVRGSPRLGLQPHVAQRAHGRLRARHLPAVSGPRAALHAAGPPGGQVPQTGRAAISHVSVCMCVCVCMCV